MPNNQTLRYVFEGVRVITCTIWKWSIIGLWKCMYGWYLLLLIDNWHFNTYYFNNALLLNKLSLVTQVFGWRRGKITKLIHRNEMIIYWPLLQQVTMVIVKLCWLLATYTFVHKVGIKSSIICIWIAMMVTIRCSHQCW